MSDLRIPLPLRVWTDSTATIGICGRQGLGKLRHVDTQCLWIQQRVRDGSVELRKVRGEVNPADLFTKHLPSRDKVQQLLALFNCRYEGGRAEGAPQLRRGDPHAEPVLLADTDGATIEQEGIPYPGVWSEGELVPEARLHDASILPHQYGEKLQYMFPRAVAAEAPGDNDVTGDDPLLRRGLEIGAKTRWKTT